MCPTSPSTTCEFAWRVRAGANVRRWTNLPAGGRFGAMEQPNLMADELRAFIDGITAR